MGEGDACLAMTTLLTFLGLANYSEMTYDLGQ